MDTDELRVQRAVRRLAELAPQIDVSPGAGHSTSGDRRVSGWKRAGVPVGAAAAVASVVLVAHGLSGRTPRSSRPTGPLTSQSSSAAPSPTPSPTDKPYGNPSIGTVPGENENQAGQLRAAKVIVKDPAYGGIVLGHQLITAYLTRGYRESTLTQARATLNPGDRLRVVIVERTWHELNQINNRFNNMFSKFESAGVRLGTSGIDVRRNEVYVETPDVAKAREVLSRNGLGDAHVDVRYIKKIVYGTTF